MMERGMVNAGSKRPQVLLPQMCQKHQALLVQHAGYGPEDTWRSLIVAAQIALFQAATADPQTHKEIGGDVTRMVQLGCLACYKPKAFDEIAEVARSHDLAQIKDLGERWVKDGSI